MPQKQRRAPFEADILVVWVTRVVCNMDKGTILVCEFGNASAHDSGVVEVEVELGERAHVGTMFRSRALASNSHNLVNSSSQTRHWQRELHGEDTEDDFQLKG